MRVLTCMWIESVFGLLNALLPFAAFPEAALKMIQD